MPILSTAAWRAQQALLNVTTQDALLQRERAERAEARIIELTDQIITMKRAGYMPREAEPQPVAPEPVTPISVALRKVPPRFRSRVAGEAQLWRLEGMSEAQIAERIAVGEEVWRATHEVTT